MCKVNVYGMKSSNGVLEFVDCVLTGPHTNKVIKLKIGQASRFDFENIWAWTSNEARSI